MIHSKSLSRGISAATVKCVLEIKSKVFLRLVLPLATTLAVASLCALKSFYLNHSVAAFVAVLFLPFISGETLARERKMGRHFAAKEHGAMGGAIIVGGYAVSAGYALCISLCGLAAHAVVALLVGEPLSRLDATTAVYFCVGASLLLAASQTVFSCYCENRLGALIATAIVVGTAALAAVLSGKLPRFDTYLFPALCAVAVIVLFPLSLHAYKTRARALR